MKQRILFVLVLAALQLGIQPATAQFTVGGDPRVNPADFEITTFQTGLNYPVGMAELADGSILVAVSKGASFFSSTAGQLIRLVDLDDDGVADSQNTLADNVPCGQMTAVKVIDNLVFTTGSGKPITIYRFGATLNDPLTQVGQLTITYPDRWQHRNTALAVRPTPGQPGDYDLFFQLGSAENFEATTQTLPLTSTIGLSGDLNGDALYRVRITDQGGSVTGADLLQIATGLRNAAGLAFHPVTGDLYIAENGIDGVVDPNEPTSADELNVIPFSQIGGAVEDFGFPENYIEYRTGVFVGGGEIPPLVAFQPIPNPLTGMESEGPNDLTFAPSCFPGGLTNGVFIGFHGRFSLAGTSNEENPLVYADLEDHSYFHFVGVDEPAVGHLIGLLTAGCSLFIADISPTGGFGTSAGNTGKIYWVRRTAEGVTCPAPDVDLPFWDGVIHLGEEGTATLNLEAPVGLQLAALANAANLTLLDLQDDQGQSLVGLGGYHGVPRTVSCPAHPEGYDRFDWTGAAADAPPGATLVVGACDAGTSSFFIEWGDVCGRIARTDPVLDLFSVAKETETLPRTHVLAQNYPNPFNPSTVIRYTLAQAGPVQLVIHDLLGREITTLVDGFLPAGSHEARFTASDLGAGLYLYTLKTPAFSQTRRMVLLK